MSHHPHTHDHPHGLRHDLAALGRQLPPRRQALRWLAAGACTSWMPLAFMGCGGGGDDAGETTANSGSVGTSTSEADSGSAACSTIPTETAGPYPADGSLASSQRLNALTLSGFVRSDIRTSVGSASGTALGVPLTVTLNLVNAASSCASLAGYAVYVWHCTRDGGYSLYSAGVTGENFLRGVQVSDANGRVSFTTIFPGCYSGRWPHIHFEVYPSLAAAIDSSVVSDHVKVSQLALPAAACAQVYGIAAGYASSLNHFAGVSLASDNVFGNDSAAQQMASVAGNASDGFTASLQVGVAV